MIYPEDRKWKDATQILKKGIGRSMDHPFAIAKDKTAFEIRIGFEARLIAKVIEELGVFEGKIPEEISEFAQEHVDIHKKIKDSHSPTAGLFEVFDHSAKKISKDDASAWILKQITCLPAIIVSLDVFDAKQKWRTTSSGLFNMATRSSCGYQEVPIRYKELVKDGFNILLPSNPSFDQVSAWFEDQYGLYVSTKIGRSFFRQIAPVTPHLKRAALKWAYYTPTDDLKRELTTQNNLHERAQKELDGYNMIDFINASGVLDCKKLLFALENKQLAKEDETEKPTTEDEDGQKQKDLFRKRHFTDDKDKQTRKKQKQQK